MSEIREYLEDLRDHWDDSYWRADHPEVMAVVCAIVTGALGLLFTYLQAKIARQNGAQQ
jgi:hypothetical protein